MVLGNSAVSPPSVLISVQSVQFFILCLLHLVLVYSSWGLGEGRDDLLFLKYFSTVPPLPAPHLRFSELKITQFLLYSLNGSFNRHQSRKLLLYCQAIHLFLGNEPIHSSVVSPNFIVIGSRLHCFHLSYTLQEKLTLHLLPNYLLWLHINVLWFIYKDTPVLCMPKLSSF